MKALIVDDEANIRKTFKMLLSEINCKAIEAGRVADAKTAIEGNYIDFAFIDLRLPDGDGMEVLKYFKSFQPDAYAIVITAFASADTAVEAMKIGAYDYVTKPFNLDELRVIIKNITDNITLKMRLNSLQKEQTFSGIIGQSQAIKEVFKLIDKIAPFDTSVLIIGQSGTGKELVARAIHERSQRADKPFVAINCASLPAELLESELFGYIKGSFTGAYNSRKGIIEEAHLGSLFLDEIGEMPLSTQSKLLRFIEDRKIRPIGSNAETEVDVRIIAASNKNLLDDNVFRNDLYHRISAFVIKMPSLKERLDDIPLLVKHFADTLSAKFRKQIVQIDPQLIQDIMQMELKGNVRELRNIIERAVILMEDGVLRLQTNKPDPCTPQVQFTQKFNLDEYLQNIERQYLTEALKMANGVKTKAAELLGLTFREFRYRLSKYKISD